MQRDKTWREENARNKYIRVRYVTRFVDTHRCPGPRCGKWSEAACVVRKAARERLVSPCSVRGRNQGRRSSGRWDSPSLYSRHDDPRSGRPESRRSNVRTNTRSISPPIVRSSQQRSLPRQSRVSRGHVVFESWLTPGQSASRTRTRNADRERGRPIWNEGGASPLIIIFFPSFFEGRGSSFLEIVCQIAKRDRSTRLEREMSNAVLYCYMLFVHQMITKAPLECMCRPCTSVEEYAIIPQEIAGFADEGPFATSAHFRRSSGLQ